MPAPTKQQVVFCADQTTVPRQPLIKSLSTRLKDRVLRNRMSPRDPTLFRHSPPTSYVRQAGSSKILKTVSRWLGIHDTVPELFEQSPLQRLREVVGSQFSSGTVFHPDFLCFNAIGDKDI